MSLGKWQLDRLAWKQQILRNIETRITDPEVPLPTTFDPAVDKYQSVSMRGTLRAILFACSAVLNWSGR